MAKKRSASNSRAAEINTPTDESPSVATLPKSITPCPLVEAIAELRFESIIPGDFVLAFAHMALKETYGEPERLPLADVPQKIRDNDPGFRFLPLYKFEKGNFTVQIGPNAVAVICKNGYVGWSEFCKEIIRVFELLYQYNVIKTESRLGFRYVSIFEENVLPRLNVEFGFDDAVNGRRNYPLTGDVSIRSYIRRGNHVCNLLLSNLRDLEHIDGEQFTVIDIDVVNSHITNFNSELERYLNESHDIEKRLFFGLLRPEFLQSLNPIY